VPQDVDDGILCGDQTILQQRVVNGAVWWRSYRAGGRYPACAIRYNQAIARLIVVTTQTSIARRYFGGNVLPSIVSSAIPHILVNAIDVQVQPTHCR
jgi:hypothetical protein